VMVGTLPLLMKSPALPELLWVSTARAALLLVGRVFVTLRTFPVAPTEFVISATGAGPCASARSAVPVPLLLAKKVVPLPKCIARSEKLVLAGLALTKKPAPPVAPSACARMAGPLLLALKRAAKPVVLAVST